MGDVAYGRRRSWKGAAAFGTSTMSGIILVYEGFM